MEVTCQHHSSNQGPKCIITQITCKDLTTDTKPRTLQSNDERNDHLTRLKLQNVNKVRCQNQVNCCIVEHPKSLRAKRTRISFKAIGS